MTTKYKTRSFIFKKMDRGESDRIFSVFTEDFGRLDVFAKSIRKSISKLKGGIDLFFISDIEFVQGKNRKTLTDAILVDKFNNIYRDLEKFKIVNKIGNILDNFIKGEEKDKEIFVLLRKSIKELNDQQNNKIVIKQLTYYYFLWNVLSLLGYHLEVQKCNICQSKLDPEYIHFSYKLGGTICKICLKNDIQAQKINSDIVKILRLIFKKNWETLSKLKINLSSQKLLDDVSIKVLQTFCPS